MPSLEVEEGDVASCMKGLPISPYSLGCRTLASCEGDGKLEVKELPTSPLSIGCENLVSCEHDGGVNGPELMSEDVGLVTVSKLASSGHCRPNRSVFNEDIWFHGSVYW